MVIAFAKRDGIESEIERIPINWIIDEPIRIDPTKPILWMRKQQTNSTKNTYEVLGRLNKYKGRIVGPTVIIGGEGGVQDWIELTTFEDKHIDPQLIEDCLEALRKIQTEGQVKIESKALWFETGQALLDWVEEVRTELRPDEFKQ